MFFRKHFGGVFSHGISFIRTLTISPTNNLSHACAQEKTHEASGSAMAMGLSWLATLPVIRIDALLNKKGVISGSKIPNTTGVAGLGGEQASQREEAQGLRGWRLKYRGQIRGRNFGLQNRVGAKSRQARPIGHLRVTPDFFE
jgi:hypothetical protein